MAKMRYRRVWVRVGEEVKSQTLATKNIKDVLGFGVRAAHKLGTNYFATYHGQFTIRHRDEPHVVVMHLDTKDAMVAALCLLGGST